MYRFNAIPIKILANICGNLQADSKMYKEMQRAKIMLKKNKVRKLKLSNTKYKAKEIKTVQYWHKIERTGPWNKTVQKKSHTYVVTPFVTKMSRQLSG